MRRINLKKASVARPNTIRDINRQIVLNYVREKGPISRAKIAQEVELQRSTISLIVDELKAINLIEEVSGESSGGRPPIMLSLRTANAIAIGIDLTIEQTIVGTSDLTGRLLEQESFPTHPNAEKTTARILNCVLNIIEKNRGTIEGIGISVPGLVEPENDSKLFVPHFNWRNPGIVERIRQATKLPVKADNDANAAALAELWFGRPEIHDVRDFIMVLIEAGIGTGVVFDGQVYRGAGGAAGEFGHMTIGTDAPIACAAGSHQCWEAFASERAALARYKKLMGDSDDAVKINFVELVERALAEDKKAQIALKKTAHYIGVGISNLIQGLSPEAVIVGGTIVRVWSLIAEDVRKAAEAHVRHGMPATPITASTLGSRPTLMGAISLILAAKFASASRL